MPPDSDPLAEIVESNSPETALFIGPLAKSAAESYGANHAGARLTVYQGTDPLADLGKLGRVDLAVIAHGLEMLEKRRAGHLLAALRDVHSRCLVVAVRLGDNWPGLISHWSENELLAFGMRRRAHVEQQGRPIGVYEFNIKDYKINPDWLNPRHWAHPELWDAYRW